MPAARRGRPAIGPKVQTQVPESYKDQLRKEALERGVDEAVVVREYLLLGLETAGASA